MVDSRSDCFAERWGVAKFRRFSKPILSNPRHLPTGVVVLTGATGFIGQRVAEILGANETPMCLIGRRGVTLYDSGKETVIFDGHAATASTLLRLFGSIRASCVIHLATCFAAQHRVGEVSKLVDSNVVFGAEVLEAAAKAEIPVVLTSSYWQYMEGEHRKPNSLYAASKNALLSLADYYKLWEDLSFTELVLYDVYGPRDPRRKITSLLLQAIKDGSEIELTSGTQLINLTHVDDVACGVLLAATRASRGSGAGLFTLRSDDFLTIRELASAVEDVVGRTLNAKWGTRPDRPGEMRSPWLVGEVLPGWIPTVSLKDGLRKLVEQQ